MGIVRLDGLDIVGRVCHGRMIVVVTRHSTPSMNDPSYRWDLAIEPSSTFQTLMPCLLHTSTTSSDHNQLLTILQGIDTCPNRCSLLLDLATVPLPATLMVSSGVTWDAQGLPPSPSLLAISTPKLPVSKHIPTTNVLYQQDFPLLICAAFVLSFSW